MDRSGGRAIFILRAASPIAPSKQADQPAANSCSGLVPAPALTGTECLMSRRPSELRDAPPSRPPVVWTLAVYSTFLSWAPGLTSSDVLVVFIVESLWFDALISWD